MDVCVFCGSSPGVDPSLMATAGELGEALAATGIGLVYGGGGAGLMGAVSDGALRGGGRVTGVMPEGLMVPEMGRTDLYDLRVVATMHERKALMYELSSAFVTLPGGLGTFEELFEAVTWTKLGFHAKPSFVLSPGGWYDPLGALLDHARDSGFLSAEDRNLVTILDTVPQVVEALRLMAG